MLAGFLNGIFLIFIAFFIFSEAIEVNFLLAHVRSIKYGFYKCKL